MLGIAGNTTSPVAAVVNADGQFLFVRGSGIRPEIIVHLKTSPPATSSAANHCAMPCARQVLEETSAWDVPQQVVGIFSGKPGAAQDLPARGLVRPPTGSRDRRRPPGPTGILRARWLDRSRLATLEARHRGPLLVARCVDDYLAGARYPLSCLTHLMRSVEPTLELSASITASG